MLALFGVLIIISSIILGLIVLIQNPKGGGLSGAFGGIGNQIMGVKQTTDALEKGTWIFASVVGILCLISPAFIPKEGTDKEDILPSEGEMRKSTQQKPASQPANTAPMPGAKTDTGN